MKEFFELFFYGMSHSEVMFFVITGSFVAVTTVALAIFVGIHWKEVFSID